MSLPQIKRCPDCGSDNVNVYTYENGWQPIETAPKECTFVLLYSATIGRAITGLWAGKESLPKTVREIWPDLEGKWCEGIYVAYDEAYNPYRPIHEVTHWRPLPSPPKENTND